VLDGPVNVGNCKAIVEEFQMATEETVRFWEASQDSCILKLEVHWHIGSTFEHYLEDAAILQAHLELGPCRHILEMHRPRLATCSCKV
jgi:hypothetical protein